MERVGLLQSTSWNWETEDYDQTEGYQTSYDYHSGQVHRETKESPSDWSKETKRNLLADDELNENSIYNSDYHYVSSLGHNVDYNDETSTKDYLSDDSPVKMNRYYDNAEWRSRYSAPYVDDATERLLQDSHYEEERGERRSTGSVIAKFFLFCTMMILFFVLMYIPVYNKVNTQLNKGTVAGWTVHTNRDTRIYVQPGNMTLIHDPKSICPVPKKDSKSGSDQLFLLIIVCSSTVNFKARSAIRDTWANYDHYLAMSKAIDEVRNNYKYYNYSYDLNPTIDDIDPNKTSINLNLTEDVEIKNTEMKSQSLNSIEYENKGKDAKLSHKKPKQADSDALVRNKRSISNLAQLLPNIAVALQKQVENADDNVNDSPEIAEEVRFEDTSEEKLLTQFEMDKVLGDEKSEELLDYDETNIMKIPAPGDEDSTDLEKVLRMLKKTQAFVNLNKTNVISHSEPSLIIDNKIVSNKLKEGNVVRETYLKGAVRNSVGDSFKVKSTQKARVDLPVFKVIFLLGLPSQENDSDVQSRIDEEASAYGDIIQEGFIDSYNNLTLKSIMMLKWVVNNCNRNVRYVLKTDDDMFINVPNLVRTLRNKSAEYEAELKKSGSKFKEEQLLIGDLISGARPVSDSSNKWYSPRYMYGGRVYPRYLSGTGYALSWATALALYRAALVTPLFHLEDIYITGMCAARATPRIRPRDDSGFSYVSARGGSVDTCAVYAQVTQHRAPTASMYELVRHLTHPQTLDRCERIRLTQKKGVGSNRLAGLYKYLSGLVSKGTAT